MKIMKLLLFFVLSISIFTSCDVPFAGEKDLYDQYTYAKKAVTKTSSFTKQEDVNIIFQSQLLSTSANASTILKFVNSDSNTWSIDFNIANMEINAFFEDSKLYIDFAGIKAVVRLPSVLAKPSFLSMINDNSKKNLVSSSLTENVDGSKTITLVFKSDETISNIDKLSKFGLNGLEIVDIQPSEVVVTAEIDSTGLLVSETSQFNTQVKLMIDKQEYSGNISYTSGLKNYDFYLTQIQKPDINGYQIFELEEIKNSITELLNQLNYQ